MHLVLDVDKTLIHGSIENDKVKITARPYLDKFLEYVFTHCETVSIWTAATPEWFWMIYDLVLKHRIPEGKSFHFVRCRPDCTSKTVNGSMIYEKPLSILWEKYSYMNSKNTFIVDDNPDTYRSNPMNGIPIRAFSHEDVDNDLMNVLCNLGVGTFDFCVCAS